MTQEATTRKLNLTIESVSPTTRTWNDEEQKRYQIKALGAPWTKYAIPFEVPREWASIDELEAGSAHTVVMERGRLKDGQDGSKDYHYFWNCVGFDGYGQMEAPVALPSKPMQEAPGQQESNATPKRDSYVDGQRFGMLFGRAFDAAVTHTEGIENQKLFKDAFWFYFGEAVALEPDAQEWFLKEQARRDSHPPQPEPETQGVDPMAELLQRCQNEGIRGTTIVAALPLPGGYDNPPRVSEHIGAWASAAPDRTLNMAWDLIKKKSEPATPTEQLEQELRA